MSSLINDIKYAFRRLRKSPGFTAVAVLTLALAIGISTAIFSGVDALWFNPVPAADPDRLVGIGVFAGLRSMDHDKVGRVILQELRAHQECFMDLARIAMRPTRSWLNEKEGSILQFNGTGVSANFFTFFNVRPCLGRTFAPDEDQRGAAPVIVLSFDLWKKLGGDPGWVGKSIRLRDESYNAIGEVHPCEMESEAGREGLDKSYTVIGVMPPYFKDFPYHFSCDYWEPVGDPEIKPADQDPQGWWRFDPYISIIARLAPGVSLKQAQALVDVLAQRHEEEVRRYGMPPTPPRVRPLREAFGVAEVRRTIPGFLGAMIFVVLIACANVANLNLARIEARQHELAMRGALGARRLQLLRQLLLESLLPALAGGAAGIAMTCWCFGLMERLLPPNMARLRPIELDWRVLAYSLFIAVIAGLISGTVPAWYGATRSVAELLKQSGVQATHGFLRNLYRRGLIVVEVSMAVVLLVGAGLMVQSVIRLLRTDLGFNPRNLVGLDIARAQGSKKYGPLEAKNFMLEEIHRRLSAMPEVEAVGIIASSRFPNMFLVSGQTEPIRLSQGACGLGTANPFKAMRAPLLRGRYPDKTDVNANPTAVVVNNTLAQRCWPGENAIGKTIRPADPKDRNIAWVSGIINAFEVVGVVGDAQNYRFPTTQISPTFWQPHQTGFTCTTYSLYVRTRTEPHRLIKPLLAEMKSSGQPIQPAVWVCKDVFYESTRPHRIYMYYLCVFGAVGLLLAGVGVYAILAYSIALREREIGIRMALGATESGVVRMVVRQGMILVAIGVGIGLGAAWALTRLLRSMLYEISPMDPLALTVASAVLILIALSACYIPARHAAKIDPMEALRYE